jgi:lipid A 3-O-deacylase
MSLKTCRITWKGLARSFAAAWLAGALWPMMAIEAHAARLVDAVVLDVGRSRVDEALGRTEVDAYRLGLQHAFENPLWQGQRARLSVYLEGSVNHWDGDDTNLTAIALSPVFMLSWPVGTGRFEPYLEGGIGAAFLSRTSIGGREFSTSFQFEDRLGIGLRGQRIDVHYRFMHYSNGGLKKPNNGIDFHVIGLAIRF